MRIKFKKIVYINLFLICQISLIAQDFPPAVGHEGSTAIHADSSVIIGWAASCEIERGFINISDTSISDQENNHASYGENLKAVGAADNLVVSLGDGGIATLYFENSIQNNPGFDFAVFENSFLDTFLELAFVEVSSNGIHFVRFPAYSNTQTETQIETFGEIDPTYIHNLAGKYRALYGTPFDLNDIADSSGIDLNNIHFVRIVDVVGSIDETYGTKDANGNFINDPWPTPFNNCGFDLDAVGVLQSLSTITDEDANISLLVFPNPVEDELSIKIENQKVTSIAIFNQLGEHVNSDIQSKIGNKLISIDMTLYPPGLYIIIIYMNDEIYCAKIIKE